MKRLFKITSLILIQAFLAQDLSFATGRGFFSQTEDNYLAPSIELDNALIHKVMALSQAHLLNYPAAEPKNKIKDEPESPERRQFLGNITRELGIVSFFQALLNAFPDQAVEKKQVKLKARAWEKEDIGLFKENSFSKNSQEEKILGLVQVFIIIYMDILVKSQKEKITVLDPDKIDKKGALLATNLLSGNNMAVVDKQEYDGLKYAFSKQMYEAVKDDKEFIPELEGLDIEKDLQEIWVKLMYSVLPKYFASRGVLFWSDFILAESQEKGQYQALDTFGLAGIDKINPVNANLISGGKINLNELHIQMLSGAGESFLMAPVEMFQGKMVYGNIINYEDGIRVQAGSIADLLLESKERIDKAKKKLEEHGGGYAELKTWQEYLDDERGDFENISPLLFLNAVLTQRINNKNSLSEEAIVSWLTKRISSRFSIQAQAFRRAQIWKGSPSLPKGTLNPRMLEQLIKNERDAILNAITYAQDRDMDLELALLVNVTDDGDAELLTRMARLNIIDGMINYIAGFPSKFPKIKVEQKYPVLERLQILGQLANLTPAQIRKIAKGIYQNDEVKVIRDFDEFAAMPVKKYSLAIKYKWLIRPGASGVLVGLAMSALFYLWQVHRRSEKKRAYVKAFKSVLSENKIENISDEAVDLLSKTLVLNKRSKAIKLLNELMGKGNISFPDKKNARIIIDEIIKKGEEFFSRALGKGAALEENALDDKGVTEKLKMEYDINRARQELADKFDEVINLLETEGKDNMHENAYNSFRDRLDRLRGRPVLNKSAVINQKQELDNFFKEIKMVLEGDWNEKLKVSLNRARTELTMAASVISKKDIDDFKTRLDDLAASKPETNKRYTEIRKRINALIKQIKNARKQAEINNLKSQNLALEQEEVKVVKQEAEDKPVTPEAKATVTDAKAHLPKVTRIIGELKRQINILEGISEIIGRVREIDVKSVTRIGKSLIVDLNNGDFIDKLDTDHAILLQLPDRQFRMKILRVINRFKIYLVPLPKEEENFIKVIPEKFSKGARFYFQINTHSEKIQKERLQNIMARLKKDGTTGIQVLDYILQVEEPEGDITKGKDITDNSELAIRMITRQKFGLIHGAFGTKKTSVLLEGVEKLVLDKKKPIMILTPQHKIADEITKRAAEDGIPVLRVGNVLERFDTEVQENFSRQRSVARKKFEEQYKQLNTGDADNGFLFVGTVVGGGLDKMITELLDDFKTEGGKKMLKDITILVDEAALVNYPELVTAIDILNPHALFLIGDHIQFSPYKLSAQFNKKDYEDLKEHLVPGADTAIRRYERSIFKELIIAPLYKKVRVCLPENWRNHHIIVELGQYWYKNVLKLESISKKNNEALDEDTLEIIDTSDNAIQSYEVKDKETGSYSNTQEAELTIEKIRQFLNKSGKDGTKYRAEDITIITPYRGQVKLIQGWIENEESFNQNQKQVLINNVITSRRAQGVENKIVIIPLVRNKKDVNNNGNDFNQDMDESIVADPALLLVSITRATEKTVIIGNRRTLKALTRNSKIPLARGMYEHLFDFGIEMRKRVYGEQIKRQMSEGISKTDNVFGFPELVECAI